MATASVTLSGVSPAAERALFAFPQWTEMDTESATTATATHSAVAGYQHCVTHVTVSFAAVTTAATTLTIKDGATVIWTVNVGVGLLSLTENFETRPLHASANADLVATMGSGGAGISGAISMAGFSVKQA